VSKGTRRRRFGWIFSRKGAGAAETWYAQWVERRPGQPSRRVTRAVGSKAEAKEFLDDLEKKALVGSYSTPPTVAETETPPTAAPTPASETFVAYAERILKDRLKADLRPKTIELYGGNVAALSGFFGERTVTADDGTTRTVPAKRLDELRSTDFLDYRAWRRTNCRWKYGAVLKDEEGNEVGRREVANSTLNRDHNFALLILGHAVADGLIPENPLARVRAAGGRSKGVAKLRESESRRVVLSKAEVARLILACDPQLRPLVLAALFTGCRRGELLDLRWRDVSFDRMKVSVVREKDRSADQLDLHPVLKEELEQVRDRRKENKAPGDFVFLNRYGEQWKDVRRAWGRALKQAKLGDRPGLVFHALRHTFATHFLEGGGAITDLQAQLGHSKVSTTQRYTRMVDERRKATVLALDYGTKAATKPDGPTTKDGNAAATGTK
jgi:integrase